MDARIRRFSVTVVVLAVLVAVPCAPAGAAPARTRTAIASVFLDDGLNTNVGIQGTVLADGTIVERSLFLFVSQSFCDEATNEYVFRSFFSQEPLSRRELLILPRLRGAVLDARVVVSVSEQRSPGCDGNPSGGAPTDLGTRRATVRVLWKGKGPVTQVGADEWGRDAAAWGRLRVAKVYDSGVFAAEFGQLRTSVAQP